MRPINNIVDITNYVMLELGYPLLAFDIDRVGDKTIVVRHAKEGEDLLLLNGTTKKLVEEDLLIADAAVPIGLAGVMGGFDSEITAETQNILIECAVFDKENIIEMWIEGITKEKIIQEIVDNDNLEEVLELYPQYAFTIDGINYKYSQVE